MEQQLIFLNHSSPSSPSPAPGLWSSHSNEGVSTPWLVHPHRRSGCLPRPLSRSVNVQRWSGSKCIILLKAALVSLGSSRKTESELLLKVATEAVLSARRLGSGRPSVEELTTGTEALSVSRGGVNGPVMVADRVRGVTEGMDNLAFAVGVGLLSSTGDIGADDI